MRAHFKSLQVSGSLTTQYNLFIYGYMAAFEMATSYQKITYEEVRCQV